MKISIAFFALALLLSGCTTLFEIQYSLQKLGAFDPPATVECSGVGCDSD